jgi:hypothetical protein
MKSLISAFLVLVLGICPAIAQDSDGSTERPANNTAIAAHVPQGALGRVEDAAYGAAVIPGLQEGGSGSSAGVLDDLDGLCPPDAVAEGEPPPRDGYWDEFNGGCNSVAFGTPFQAIDWTNDNNDDPLDDGEAWLCGRTGLYVDSDGLESRDTDWYRVIARQDGVMNFTAESEQPCSMFKLAPLNCRDVAVELSAVCWNSHPQTLSFPVTEGEEIWLWVGPYDWTSPVSEFTYFMTVTNNTFDTVPSEGMSWGGLKVLYR